MQSFVSNKMNGKKVIYLHIKFYLLKLNKKIGKP